MGCRGTGLQIPSESTLTPALAGMYSAFPGPQVSEPFIVPGCGPAFLRPGKDGGGAVGVRQECHLVILEDVHSLEERDFLEIQRCCF